MKYLYSVIILFMLFAIKVLFVYKRLQLKFSITVKDTRYDVQNIFLATPYRDSDCPEGAPVGLGVSNGRRIPDGAFTASSSHVNREPAKGRLDEQSGMIT